MNKPTISSVNLIYIEERKKYVVLFTINTSATLEYIVVDTGNDYDNMLHDAEELATRIKTEFINEVKKVEVVQ
jgi:hypothetical protein